MAAFKIAQPGLTSDQILIEKFRQEFIQTELREISATTLRRRFKEHLKLNKATMSVNDTSFLNSSNDSISVKFGTKDSLCSISNQSLLELNPNVILDQSTNNLNDQTQSLEVESYVEAKTKSNLKIKIYIYCLFKKLFVSSTKKIHISNGTL
jgi:hypothetical protein